MTDIPPIIKANCEYLAKLLRLDQAGEWTFDMAVDECYMFFHTDAPDWYFRMRYVQDKNKIIYTIIVGKNKNVANIIVHENNIV